jgi:glycosyltransferase involved in cell wall biosynthesis
LVVDDASKDNTREIVNIFIKEDARVTLMVLTQNSGGGAVPRTTGCKAARGEFVAFLDQDDLYMPRYLEKKVAYFDAHHEISLLSSLAWSFNDDEEDKKIINCEFGGPLNTLIRKEALEKSGYFKESETNADDMGMAYRFLKIYGLKSSAIVPGEPLTLYARHAGQESHTENRDPSIFIKRIDSVLSGMEENKDPGIKDIISHLYSRKANFYCLLGDFKTGRIFFRKSLSQKFNVFSGMLMLISYCPVLYKRFVSFFRFFRVNIIARIQVFLRRIKYPESYETAKRILETIKGEN